MEFFVILLYYMQKIFFFTKIISNNYSKDGFCLNNIAIYSRKNILVLLVLIF
jgi:hypothetical protein